MDLRIFVESLSLYEMNEISSLIYDKKRELARRDLKPLSPVEMELVSLGKYIDAIRSHRARLGSDLFTAKLAVDTYRAEILTKESKS